MEGNTIAPTKLSAKEMTAEIDRVTDWELGLDRGTGEGANADAERMNTWNMGRQEVRAMGGVALDRAEANPDMAENERSGEEIVKAMVAAENGYAKSELAPGANVIGAESKLEIKEREQHGREQFKIETGNGWEHEILTKSQERLTDKTVDQIHHVIKEKAYHPAELEQYRHLGMTAILRTYGRNFGDN